MAQSAFAPPPPCSRSSSSAVIAMKQETSGERKIHRTLLEIRSVTVGGRWSSPPTATDGTPAHQRDPPNRLPPPHRQFTNAGPGVPGPKACQGTQHPVVGFKLRVLTRDCSLLITLPANTFGAHDPTCTREIFSRAPSSCLLTTTTTNPSPCLSAYIAWCGLVFRSQPLVIASFLEASFEGTDRSS